jgi:hypothetical protein
MKLATLQNGIELTNMPNVVYSIRYVKGSKTVTWEVLFVTFMSVLSLVSPVAESPIYRSHRGPHSVSLNFTVGGGIGIGLSKQLNPSDIVPAGVVAGRAVVNSASALGIPPHRLALRFHQFFRHSSGCSIPSASLIDSLR